MNLTRLCLALGLGVAVPAGCSQPLDLCADQAGACLTVQVTADSTASVDLLRALYQVSPAALQERLFAGPSGAAFPLGFELALPMGGMVHVDVIAESALQPVLHGSAQATLGPTEHQQVTIPLNTDVANLPYVGPAPRHHAGIVFSPARQAVVLFGGTAANGTVLSDTWELDSTGTTWTSQTAAGPIPSPRNATLAYDPVQSQVVMAGGSGTNGVPVPDMWTYDRTGSWTLQAQNVGGGSRVNAGMTVTDQGVAVIAGGEDPTGKLLTDIQTAAADKTKTYPDFMPHMGSAMLPQIKGPKLVYLTATAGLYVLGADEASNGGITLWQISGALALPAAPLLISPVVGSEVSSPSRRTDYAVAADSAAGLIYLFGGSSTQNSQYLQDAYVFDVQAKQWAMISPSSTALPQPRAGAALVLMPPGLLLLGGMTAKMGPTATALDNWKLTPSPFASPTVSGVYTRHL